MTTSLSVESVCVCVAVFRHCRICIFGVVHLRSGDQNVWAGHSSLLSIILQHIRLFGEYALSSYYYLAEQIIILNQLTTIYAVHPRMPLR